MINSAKIGIVICNFNKQNDVLICIQSVLESKFTDYHIYVVDNASSDDSVLLINEKYKDEHKLTLIVNSENLGGSGGFNTGLRAALKNNHEYLMCVDNDAMLDENCIGELCSFLDNHEDVGIAAAKIYHTGQENYVQQYGSFIDFKNYSVDSTYLNHLEDGSMPDVVYSDAVPACALMIKRIVVEQIGLMPEENFLYWDDTEWCVRCKEAGYKVASVGAAAACHAMGAKKEDVNTFPTYYAWRNWIKFFLNHIKPEQLPDMAETFLGSIFEINYIGLYRNEKNKSKTVMAALDDALHNVMGKAGNERIFNLEFTYDGLKKALEDKKKVIIIANDFPLFAESLKEKIETEYEAIDVELVTTKSESVDVELVTTKSETIGVESVMTKSEAVDGNLPLTEQTGKTTEVNKTQSEANGKSSEAHLVNTYLVNTHDTAVLDLCESIFRQDDLSLERYKMDLDGNVLRTEDDALMVINYAFSRRSFIFAMKPLFMRLARENVILR